MIVAADVEGLATLRAVPPAPSAALLFVHGLAEHARRHEPTLAMLAARGIAAFAFDLPGHGASAGARDYVGDFDRLVARTQTMRHEVARVLPGVPLVLAGFSMGALVVLRSAEAHAGDLAGLILIAPGLDPAGRAPRVLKRIGLLLGRYVPFLPVARVDFSPSDHIAGDRIAGDRIAGDEAPRRRRRIIAARTAAELMRASSAAFRGAGDLQLPLLIFHGDRDRLVSAHASRRYARAYGGADVTLRIVPGGEHELLREPTSAAVRDELVAWTMRHARAVP